MRHPVNLWKPMAVRRLCALRARGGLGYEALPVNTHKIRTGDQLVRNTRQPMIAATRADHGNCDGG